ncbi:MAG: hypothetical protein PGMFKBFP_01749 [Anaerolineales bacterium]|nr:hypothetical protein [Anaerolineales bacterium]
MENGGQAQRQIDDAPVEQEEDGGGDKQPRLEELPGAARQSVPREEDETSESQDEARREEHLLPACRVGWLDERQQKQTRHDGRQPADEARFRGARRQRGKREPKQVRESQRGDREQEDAVGVRAGGVVEELDSQNEADGPADQQANQSAQKRGEPVHRLPCILLQIIAPAFRCRIGANHTRSSAWQAKQAPSEF